MSTSPKKTKVRVTSTLPKVRGKRAGYNLHSATVTVHGATPEQLVECEKVASSSTWHSKDSARSDRWFVLQPPTGGVAGGADRDAVAHRTDLLVVALSKALGL